MYITVASRTRRDTYKCQNRRFSAEDMSTPVLRRQVYHASIRIDKYSPEIDGKIYYYESW